MTNDEWRVCDVCIVRFDRFASSCRLRDSCIILGFLMALADFLAELDALAREATAAFAAAGDAAALEAARIEFLGAKSGRLKAVQKGLGQVDKADKPAAGKRFNEVKQAIEAAYEAADAAAGRRGRLRRPRRGDSIPRCPASVPRLGHLHPITQTIEELKEIMGRLGFSVADGPEVEDHWHNFEALNIPPEHPARDPLENFYLAAGAGGRGRGQTESGQSTRIPDPCPRPSPCPLCCCGARRAPCRSG